MRLFAGSRTVLLLVLLALAPHADARLEAAVDRTEVALGETLRLTITATDDEQPADLDLDALRRDFEILQRSTATNARIVNGEQSVTRTLELELSPQREGILTIPTFPGATGSSTPIAIRVTKAPQLPDTEATVLFDASVDTERVYVQAQVVLTITLQQAINLDGRQVTEIDLDGAFVSPLEQRSFQRRANGRLWQVNELRYAVFPEQSGTLEIPALTFSAREILPGRSLLGARLGRRIALQSEPITLDVMPVPADFPGATWLPARALELTERWSAAPDGLTLGDSTTRTLELRAAGLPGSQLPPMSSSAAAPADGLRFYPDRETIDDREIGSGLEGYRLQSEALVTAASGSWTLPEIVIPWWNTETDTLEYARLPARTVTVAGPGVTATGTPSAPIPASVTDSGAGTITPLTLGIAASGWVVVLLLLLGFWLGRRQTAAPAGPEPDLRKPLIALRLACQQRDATAARSALLAWGRERFGGPAATTLADLARVVSPALAAELAALDRALYGAAGTGWESGALYALVRDEPAGGGPQERPALALYPTGPARR